jgi:hypothetical protein
MEKVFKKTARVLSLVTRRTELAPFFRNRRLSEVGRWKSEMVQKALA